MGMFDQKTLVIDEWHPFVNDEYEGIRIQWVANIGFGQCDLYRPKGSEQWKADTEFMGKNFLKLLLEKIADEAEDEQDENNKTLG